MKTKKLFSTVAEDFVGQRLDRYLTTFNEISSRSLAKNLIDKNLVTVDKRVERASFVLKKDQLVEIELPSPVSTEITPYNFKLDIIYEDASLLIVNKPSGLVVHPAAGHQQDTLVNALLNHTQNLSMKNEQRPGIVHRIDKETSGLLVVAKNDFAHDHLAKQFQNKTTHRIYYALVDGSIMRSSGEITSYLARHPNDRKRYASLKENNKIIRDYRGDLAVGKWAKTYYEKIMLSSSMTYTKLKLETGRTHQIRVHMSEMGHPLVGDTTYGYSVNKIKKLNITRFFLHAAELGFIHPITSKSLLFKVEWPNSDQEILNKLGFENEILKK